MAPDDSDPLGTAMALVPPAFGLLAASFDQLTVASQLITWWVTAVLIGLDSRRYEVATVFWLAAVACAWPLALLGYAFDRRSKGAPSNVLLVCLGLGIWALALALAV